MIPIGQGLVCLDWGNMYKENCDMLISCVFPKLCIHKFEIRKLTKKYGLNMPKLRNDKKQREGKINNCSSVPSEREGQKSIKKHQANYSMSCSAYPLKRFITNGSVV
jgi:hypothetical protein